MFSSDTAVDEIAFRWSYPDVVSLMDLGRVFPLLVQRGVVSANDLRILANTSDSSAKMEKLLAVLRQKGPGFLDTFIGCLRDSADGTAHNELADGMEEARSKALAEPQWKQTSKSNRRDDSNTG